MLAGVALGVILLLFVIKMPSTGVVSIPGNQPEKTYTNVEEWEFVKDKDGRVLGLKAHRNAKQT